MKKYNLFLHITLVLLCLFPLIFSCLVYFSNVEGNFDNMYQIVQSCEIAPGFTQSFKEVFADAFDITVSPGFDIFCVICSNTIFIYIGFVFVEVLVFVPKLAIKLLRIFSRKDE